jgi:hypothetical protein
VTKLFKNSERSPIRATSPVLVPVFAEDAETVCALGDLDKPTVGVGRLVESAEEMQKLFGSGQGFEPGKWVVTVL